MAMRAVAMAAAVVSAANRAGSTLPAGTPLRPMHALNSACLGALLVVSCEALLGTVSSAVQPDPLPDVLVRRAMGLSAGDMRALASGVAVVRSLETPVRQEFAHLGAVRINAPYERFLERFRDIERFERGPGVPQIGRVGMTPRLDDLAPLQLPPGDVRSLAACRPGSCDVQLGAAVIARFQKEVKWSSPDAPRHVNDITRQMLVDLVRAYQTGGDAALGQYNDGTEPLGVAEQFRALLASSGGLPIPVPDLIAFLRDYPRSRPPGVEDFLYWTVVDFGFKPTIRLNHVVVYRLAPGLPAAYAIAIKQLYASHYFHSTLEIRFLIDDSSAPRGGTWLLSVTRSRNDGTAGFRGRLLRPMISRRSRDAVRGYLEHVKRQVERPAL